jgi:NDP-sugar pyrophosphorylase family protein
LVKERISLTLDKNLIESVDSLVNGVKFRSRSHVMEYLLNKGLGKGSLRKAFILAGGKGMKLRPITYEIPSAMVPIKGKPILEHQIELLRKYDIREIIIAIGHLGEKIKEYFGSGNGMGVDIKYIEEEKPLGTAGGLRLAKPLLDETFIMIYGDNLFNFDLNDFYAFHLENKSGATIALTTVDDPWNYGVISLRGNKIINFSEKPRKGKAETNLISTGIYIIEPEIIDIVPKGHASIENDVFVKLANQENLCGYTFSGQWFDIYTPDKYEKAIKGWKGIS